jgi:hypothetical protein
VTLHYLAKDLKLFVDGAGRSASVFSLGLIRRDYIRTDVAQQAWPK